MHRGKLTLLLSLAAVVALVGSSAAAGSSDHERQARGHELRWDIVQATQSVVLAGGSAVATDATTLDTITLTGSGGAEPGEREATGGGTFVHRHANGNEVAHGVFVVRGFVSFGPAGGTLEGTGLTDGIGEIDETSAGILTLNVRLLPSGGGSVNAVLGIHCELPGETFAVHEGVTLDVGTLHFRQTSGLTLFHVEQ